MDPVAWLLTIVSCCPGAGTGAPDYPRLPANEWTTVHREDRSGGKTFARAIYVPKTDRLYLWGTGGEKPARNVYRRYELESFDPAQPAWRPAFPDSRRSQWKPDDFPRFRIYGQSGPDGLKFDEGPRLQVVGGYHSTNRVRWWDFDGVRRPSPIHTFNMICLDSRRNRVVCYADGCTFALDPADNTWTDLAARNHPACCRALAWAALCYNPVHDEIILFGGGLATNPAGGAATRIYDCAANAWRRPDRETEPPLRCNAPIVYDPATRSAVMFGGYNQAAALNDTWIYRCEDGRWEKAAPATAPPPMYAPAAAAVPGGGKILVCGNDARKVRMHHKSAGAERKETWIYDIAANTWTPVDGDLRLRGHRWLTAAAAPRHGVIFMTAFGPDRRTLAFRCDPDAEPADLPGAPPGTVARKYPEQSASLENAPPPDPASQATVIASLPPNRFVDAEPPGMLISKTWSSATIDTDHGEVIYTGGGHSGYSGNDIARYRIADNRWRLDFPPRFPPFLESTNAGIFGWSYGMIPFSQHTYLWYCYDPRSKTVVYLARPSLFDGAGVRLGDDPGDTFVYDRKKHGCATWVYDSAAKKMHPPCFGRPFANTWHLALAGTPRRRLGDVQKHPLPRDGQPRRRRRDVADGGHGVPEAPAEDHVPLRVPAPPPRHHTRPPGAAEGRQEPRGRLRPPAGTRRPLAAARNLGRRGDRPGGGLHPPPRHDPLAGRPATVFPRLRNEANGGTGRCAARGAVHARVRDGLRPAARPVRRPGPGPVQRPPADAAVPLRPRDGAV